MDINRLCDLAAKATQHTLRYHVGPEVAGSWFDEDVQVLIREEIQELYPLRARAQDTSVADLEIACDAALTVAEAHNRTVPEQVLLSPRINLRWFYTCIQGLLLLDLKPEALLDGKVDRLPRRAQQPPPTIPPSTSDSESPPPASSSTLSPDTSNSPLEPLTPSRNKSKPVPARPAKSKWEHEEIQLMVKLKASGLRHREVATKLGRGQGSVENKYGRVMHADEWKEYSTSFEASLSPELDKKDGEDDGWQDRSP